MFFILIEVIQNWLNWFNSILIDAQTCSMYIVYCLATTSSRRALLGQGCRKGQGVKLLLGRYRVTCHALTVAAHTSCPQWMENWDLFCNILPFEKTM